MKWISVSDRLPEMEDEYIVYGIGEVTTMEWHIGRGWYSDCYEEYIDQSKVNYWMPLPEPPKY